MSATITTTIEGNVGTIILNRPDKFNAFNKEMSFALQTALDAFAADENVRCIYLTGNGKAFSAGQDIAELIGENAVSIDKILLEHFNPIVERIRKIGKPIVCAVNGVAAGAGANIALCCDVVVAAENATFIQAFSKIGLVPDSGGTYFLPRLIGFAKASALMMLGEKISAIDAEKAGMVFKTFSSETFAQESIKIAQSLAAMPTLGLAYTKQALNKSFTNSFDEQLAYEDRMQRKAASTYDYNEGINAFLEKRNPVFKGK